MRLHRIVQGIFGLILIAFSLTPIFGWEPPPVEPGAESMRDALFESGYLIPIILIVYFLVGVSWLFDRFVPLTAIVLFPISLNILLFHALVNQAPFGLIVATALICANVYMLVRNVSSYRQLLQARAS